MSKLIITIGLGLGLVASSGVALAQETINADGSNVTSTAGVNPVAEAEGPTIVYGDLNPGPGTNVIGPPAEISEAPPPPTGTLPSPEGTVGDIEAGSGNASTVGPGSASAAPGTVTEGSTGTALLGPDGTYSVSEVTPSTITTGGQGPAPAPAPVAEAAPVEAAPVEAAPVEAAPVEAAPVDATVADSDADNLVDSLETEYGLDAFNADSDADGVADGDEINIYGTDPAYGDSDGDGVLDGEELFGIQTDPLVWNDFSAQGEAAVMQEAVEGAQPVG